MGGNYDFQITSGHNRWSIHSNNNSSQIMLDTHRGTPHLVMNTLDAKNNGIKDNDMVRVYNDLGEFQVPVLISSGSQPGQVVHVQRWDPYQFPNWAGPNDIEPGMIKWLHLGGAMDTCATGRRSAASPVMPAPASDKPKWGSAFRRGNSGGAFGHPLLGAIGGYDHSHNPAQWRESPSRA